MNRWRKLSLEVFAAAFGWRVEAQIVPFQFALPQIGFSRAMGRDKRKPSLKFGPLHIWTMETQKWELGVSADFNGHFHSHKFTPVYPDSIVWPKY